MKQAGCNGPYGKATTANQLSLIPKSTHDRFTLAQKATDAFNAPICETDPEIAELLDSELGRQRSGLEMIASENFVPRAVLQCQGSVLTNKYAELPRPFLPRRGVRREPRDLPHRPGDHPPAHVSTVPRSLPNDYWPTTSRPTASPC